MTCSNLKKFLTALLRSEQGGPLAETAFTVPILMTLVMGAAEMARVSYANIEIANAARAAVSYGAQNTTTVSDTTGIQTVASDDASDLTNLTTTPIESGVCSDGTACTGTDNGAGPSCQNTDCSASSIENILTVKTSATMNPIIHVPGLPTTYALKATAVQKVVKN
jgi:Flp pilus assembly protein TadG